MLQIFLLCLWVGKIWRSLKVAIALMFGCCTSNLHNAKGETDERLTSRMQTK
ncbi:MAG: hypothetical protein KME08_19725 [Aphanothece sp. CMT-3BRIN-NPC111]|nr:hypothetical protein [Aphanothece sp. CMT-3BRIN-NPC111]